MQAKSDDSFYQELILIGGGHTHVQVLKSFAMRPLAGLRITLISDHDFAAYSGMLPGYLCGDYSLEQLMIPLEPLCRLAGARFIKASVAGIDPDKQRITLHQPAQTAEQVQSARPYLSYDRLSLNLGSQPNADRIQGAQSHAIPIKPLPAFLHWWHKLLDEQNNAAADGTATQKPKELAIIGAGAGGLELAFACNKRLNFDLPAGQAQATVHLIAGKSGILPRADQRVKQFLRKQLKARGIILHEGQSVRAIDSDTLYFESAKQLRIDKAILATQAQPNATWLAQSNISLDARGFIATDKSLRTLSHQNIFAVGDCASIQGLERDKSGVFAVRLGPKLARALRQQALGQRLAQVHLQKHYLMLLNLADKQAIALRSKFSLYYKPWFNRWLWHYKDYIDRSFMAKFTRFKLPPFKPSAAQRLEFRSSALKKQQNQPRCLGCAAKVPANVLQASLSQLGLETQAQDCQRIGQTNLYQSSDMLSAPISDPYMAGYVIALHALSDLYASAIRPLAVQAIAGVPYASDRIMSNDLSQLLAGLRDCLQAESRKVKLWQQNDLDKNTSYDAPIELIGGHSFESDKLSLGLTITGAASTKAKINKAQLKVGDKLYITKPLGTGLILAAAMQFKSPQSAVIAAYRSMMASNFMAAHLCRQAGVTAITDITGFGLVGHLNEMLRQSLCHARLNLGAIPLLEGAEDISETGLRSTLFAQNCAASGFDPDQLGARQALLFDPQTSGGLLFAVSSDKEQHLLELAAEHNQSLWQIGLCIEGDMNQEQWIDFS